MDHIKLTTDQIDVKLIHDLINDEGCGACSVFVGTTRDNFDGKKVISLEYEAYESMALKEMRKICSELRSRWPHLKHIAIFHRLGSVPVKEASVVIATSSPHRAAALESVSFAIDQLKTRVPIWKKEMYEEVSVGEWKENKECPWPKLPKSSSRTFDFSSCQIEQRMENVPDKLVQIRVNDSELNRRLDCFLKRKRDEINLQNINDFNQQTANEPNPDNSDGAVEISCARTQSFLVKQHQSSGHLKVRRVNNKCGPELGPDYSLQLNKLMTSQRNCHTTAERKVLDDSRLKDIEAYMGISSKENGNIYCRIKDIENRILLLESTSPEYKNFIQLGTYVENPNIRKPKKRTYMSDKLSEYIAKIKAEVEH